MLFVASLTTSPLYFSAHRTVTTYGKILCALSIFIGLLVAFAGHRYFQLEMFLAGFATFAAVSYVVLMNHMEANVTGVC